MKKLLFILLMVFIGCNFEPEKVKNPERITTVEILSQPRDTVELVILNNTIYLLQNDLIKYETRFVKNNYSVVSDYVILIFLFIFLTLIMVIIMYKL